MLSCLLLAAGESQRFGSPKALAKINHVTIIEQLQQRFIDAHIDELIIVLGAHAQKIEPFILKHNRIRIVYNKDYIFGQTSSFLTGFKEINKSSQGVMLLPVDYPFITLDTINKLKSEFHRRPEKIIIPVYKEKKGHPPIFSIRFKEQFLNLNYLQGINSIFKKLPDEIILFPVDDPGVIQTFNTPEEFSKITDE
ncbi:MAG: nucleotidyltransferase family protein [Candidatus Omnitrophica bacterium]|nr:nucleotidyltransferase family protein [Candidatus Omnitrophota bacterium]